MKPATSFAPALLSGSWSAFWADAVGPTAGGLIAVACSIISCGRGDDAVPDAAGSGVLTPGEGSDATASYGGSIAVCWRHHTRDLPVCCLHDS